MGISDLIAGFIRASLEDSDGMVELQRSDLAQKFNCVPSQINYVMSTRFSPENGYIRITRVRVDRQTLLMHVINSIGEELDDNSARAIVTNLAQSEAIGAETAATLLYAIGERALQTVPRPARDALRADIVKQVLIHCV